MPKWHELGVNPHKANNDYKLHCKPIPYLDPEALLSLSAYDKALTEELRELLKWTSDPSFYEACVSDKPITSRLSAPHIKLQLERGKIKVECEPLGYCKSFVVPEHAKKRWRAIQHPELINKMTADAAKVEFTSQHERHAAILKGQWAIDIDWSAFFDQFPLDERVSRFFSFKHGGKTFSMKVLPMGLKHSVAIAHTATKQLLNFEHESYTEPYIDNVRVIHDDRDTVIRDAATLVCRCVQAGVTINEVDVTLLQGLPPDQMHAKASELLDKICKQNGPWLGEEFDYEKKLVSLSQKTREKVQCCLDAGFDTFRSFAGAVAMLQYASRTLGLPLAKYFAARRAISSIAWLLEKDDRLWDMEMPPLCEDVVKNLRQWRADVLAAPPRHVTGPSPPDLVIIVDASRWGWGAIAIDELGREMSAKHAWSLADQRAFDTGSSVRSEPEGVYRSCCRFIRPGHHKKVFIWSDSSASVGAFNKQHSLSYFMNRCIYKLQCAFPGVEFILRHVPGKLNPADRGSRGDDETTPEQWDRARELADEARASQNSGPPPPEQATRDYGGAVPT